MVIHQVDIGPRLSLANTDIRQDLSLKMPRQSYPVDNGSTFNERIEKRPSPTIDLHPVLLWFIFVRSIAFLVLSHLYVPLQTGVSLQAYEFDSHNVCC